MVALTWDPKDARVASGVEMGVLYLAGQGVPWNGLVSVTEQDSSEVDAENYIDGKRHRLATDLGIFSAVVEAYTYPQEFEAYDGFDGVLDNQNRRRFGFSWRNDFAGGYQIHLVYNAQVFPTIQPATTLNGDADISPFSWTLVTSPSELTWTKSANHLVVNSVDAHPVPLARLEGYLYGTSSSAPRLPDGAEVIQMFEDYTDATITYNGDGTVTMSGPDFMVSAVDEETQEFTINLPTAFYARPGVALIRSHWRES